MKIDSNIGYTQHYKSKHGALYDHSIGKESMHAGLCEEKSVNRGYNSGSSVSFGAAASFSDKLLRKVIDGALDHTVIIQNLWALLLAIGPRPLAIMTLPDPKKKNTKDKIAASCHAIASGLVGFAFASAVMYPLGKAAKRIKTGDAKMIAERFSKLAGVDLKANTITEDELIKDAEIMGKKFLRWFGEFDKSGRLIKINKNLNFDRATKALDMSLDTFVLGIAKAMLTIRLIPPIMKYLFGIDKNKPAEPAAQTQKTEPARVEGGTK